MRTTLRIDDELMLELKERSRREKMSLAKLTNLLIRRGLAASRAATRSRPYREKPVPMGEPFVGLTKALAVASALEDEETVREMAMRK